MRDKYWKTGAPKRRTAKDDAPGAGDVLRQLGILIAGGVILLGLVVVSIGSFGPAAAGAPIAQAPQVLASPTAAAPTLAPTSTALPPTATATVQATQPSTRTPPTEATTTPTTKPSPTTAPTLAPTSTADETAATPVVSGGAVSYSRDVQPLFDQICVKCHGGEDTKEGLSLKSYAEVLAGSDNGPILTAGDAANSLLIQQVVDGKMPKRGPKLLPAQIRTLSDWVAAGAPNN